MWNKYLYKIEIWLLKIIPFILSIFYLINSILVTIGHPVYILFLISDVSVIPLLFLYISSFVFKFCTWHRIPLYYIATVELFNLIDHWWLPHVTNHIILIIYCLLFGIFAITFGLLKYLNSNKMHISDVAKEVETLNYIQTNEFLSSN